ncbi:P-loop nucleotide/nucleoside kinase family protein [Microlunatus parietis]|uniref:Uridine kinase n=1 Tax=Microlunatus parietis TaxID=682979 RepID=A0A7Y9IEW8_9ACTN|nr:hypothetical protein [Microlunatus parietis]NYE74944.1 hypothetical protein [Microlunatus parietis]
MPLVFVETRLEAVEHRRRVAQRQRGSTGYLGPTWEQLQQVPFDPWQAEHLAHKITIDTAVIEDAVAPATRWIRAYPG